MDPNGGGIGRIWSRLGGDRISNCSRLGDERIVCSIDGLGLGCLCPSAPCTKGGNGGVAPLRIGGGLRASSPVRGRPGGPPGRNGGGRLSRSPSAVGGRRGVGLLSSAGGRLSSLNGGSLLSPGWGVDCMLGGRGDFGGIWGDWLDDGEAVEAPVRLFRGGRGPGAASSGRPPVNPLSSAVLNPVKAGKSPWVYLWKILIMLPIKNSFSFAVPASQ